MKNTLVLVFACCLLAIALAKDRETLTPYPQVFTAVFNSSDIATGLPAHMQAFYLDVPNKRARNVYPSYGDVLLIFKPAGADPTSSFGKNYTQIVVNPKFPNNSTKCYYQQNAIGPWPRSWMHPANSKLFEEVGPFYALPNNLVYTGPFYVQETKMWTDRWDSTDICDLQRSGIGSVPCKSVMYTQGANPLPAMDIQASAANGFFSDSYFVRVYHTFKPFVSDKDFALPDQWQTQCANYNAGYTLSPGNRPFLLYSDGTSQYTPTLALSSAPINELGPVTVVVKSSPSEENTCTNCVGSYAKLTFTSDTWNVPKVVPLTYLKSGCSNLIVQARGGGYDQSPDASHWVVYTCVGSASRGCDVEPQC